MNAAEKIKPKKPVRLGDLLIEKGYVNQDQLRIALIEQKRRGVPLGKILIDLGFISEASMRDVLGESIGQEIVDLTAAIPDPDAIKMIPKNVARRYKILPIIYDEESKSLTIAMSDTFNIVAIDQAAALVGENIEIRTMLAGEAEIEHAIDQFYGFELSIDGILHELETGEIDYETASFDMEEYSQPLVRLVDAILADAVKRDASDIHFEPEENFLRVRYRIDGVMRQFRTLHKNYWSGISVRIKVMADLNIAETRAPQDGRISLSLIGRHIDFRVSSQPTSYGENIVLRVLDKQKGIVPLEKLGLDEKSLIKLKMLMARPEGIILVTGPTGSGKTTTLYSLLNYLNNESVNIMTLEDPVEYPMPLIRQTSVNEAAKLDFANGIRTIMRQDPDIILIGEIRDDETAEMALRAAMTGHQVYSTLHTNSAIGVIPRLLDIGIAPDIMAGNIIGVVAQRLVRKLCSHCKQAYEPEGIEAKIIDYQSPDKTKTLYKANGCSKCADLGYKGRIALMEILKFDSEIDELISRKASMRELLILAEKKGFQPISNDAIAKVKQGITSLDEISRIVDLSDRLD